MKVKDVTNYLESIAPLQLQEDYDNSGLIIGNGDDKVEGALVCLDVTEEVIREAISLGCNLIIAHHPLIFSGIRKINTNNYPSSCVVLAIKNNLNILVLGGSLGAKVFNERIPFAAKQLIEKYKIKNLEIVHQAGKTHGIAQDNYKKLNINFI